ncbi:GON-4-like protein, partial [Seriola lalandi dorsalis]|uniref:GON-4-like protein n=1 Tax=Seriola lalandi dorsalis TaxID=1841481 RepID=UPI000C6F55D3
MDEPDLEDYRTDRAVQITKREVNELLEELFDTLLEEEVAAEEQERGEEREEEEEQEEDEVPSQTGPKFNVPQALRFEAPLASMLTERRRTVRKQYEALQQRRALQDATNHHRDYINLKDTPGPQPNTATPVLVLPSRVCSTLHLDFTQKLQLQQQIQQEELHQFASRQEEMFLPSSFSHAFPLLSANTAWLFATRPVFLYPELLPVCSLDPALHSQNHRSVYTAGEDGLIVLGLKHFEGAVQSDQLISSYLLCKNRWNFRKHVREMSSPRALPNNIIKVK